MTFLILLSCQSLCHLNTREIFIEKITFFPCRCVHRTCPSPFNNVSKIKQSLRLGTLLRKRGWGRGELNFSTITLSVPRLFTSIVPAQSGLSENHRMNFESEHSKLLDYYQSIPETYNRPRLQFKYK